MKLNLGTTSDGKAFHLPMDLVTQSIAILAKRGAGKSFTASVMSEELLTADHQVIALDPTGAWWGLRSSADGKSDGFPIVVLGGDHGDLPLDENAGELLARAAVERRFSAVIDLSLFRKGQVRRFVTPFLESLYRLNREPMHLFIDEADDLAPQKPFGDEAAMVGAVEDVVKRGRKRGIGCTLITQRPADLAKQVLTQCEMVIALRLVHPRDIKAVMEWINVHADPTKAGDMLASLPALPTGTAWFWSPGWGDIFARVQVRARKTFDSGATPKPGQHAAAPSRIAPVDIERLGAEIQAAAVEAKANDPRNLKARIVELEKKLFSAHTSGQVVDAKAVDRAVTDALAKARAAWSPLVRRMESAADEAEAGVRSVRASLGAMATILEHQPAKAGGAAIRRGGPQDRPQLPPPHNPTHTRIAPPRPSLPNGHLPKAERAILTVLAQHGPCGKNRLAILAGYSANGGGFNNPLSALRTAGRIDGYEDINITEGGIKALGDWQPLPTGPDLLDHWMRSPRMGRAERAILEALRLHGPMAKVDLAERAGYAADGGGFNNPLSKLRTLKIIHGYERIELAPELVG